MRFDFSTRIFIVFLISLMTSFSMSLLAQDAHFTQFYAAPLKLNPALSGMYSGTFRISTVYRDQWFSAVDNYLRTFNASGDAKFELKYNNRRNPDLVSVGINFFSDRVSGFDFNTNEIQITTAYHKSLDKRSNKYIGIGLQGGIFQRGINYDDIFFQDQFNSLDGFTNATNESLPTNSRGYFDLSTGIHYSVAPKRGTQFHIGLGIFHITQPNLSFYNEASTIDQNISKTDTLYRKFSFHTGLSIPRSERTSIQPRVNILSQGKHLETNIGANFRYKINPREGQYISLGIYGRGIKNYDNFGLFSINGVVGYERNNFIIGLSYDQPVNQLFRDARSLSSLELSLIYIGEHHNADEFCPQF
jgi:type IX secretion system PorP/SprF family membrane protein